MHETTLDAYDIDEPELASPPTFTAQVAALEKGDTTSRSINVARMVESNVKLSKLEGTMAGRRNTFRNAVGSAVRNATRQTGNTYSVEICDLFAPSGRLFLVALVTRV